MKANTIEYALKLTQLMNSSSLAHKEKRITDELYDKIIADCQKELGALFP